MKLKFTLRIAIKQSTENLVKDVVLILKVVQDQEHHQDVVEEIILRQDLVHRKGTDQRNVRREDHTEEVDVIEVVLDQSQNHVEKEDPPQEQPVLDLEV